MLRSLTHSYFTFMKHVKRGPFTFLFFLLACREGVSGDILPSTKGKRPSRDACLLAHTCARHFTYSAWFPPQASFKLSVINKETRHYVSEVTCTAGIARPLDRAKRRGKIFSHTPTFQTLATVVRHPRAPLAGTLARSASLGSSLGCAVSPVRQRSPPVPGSIEPAVPGLLPPWSTSSASRALTMSLSPPTGWPLAILSRWRTVRGNRGGPGLGIGAAGRSSWGGGWVSTREVWEVEPRLPWSALA